MNILPPDCVFEPARPDDLEALVDLRIRAMRPSLEAAGRFDPGRARARLVEGFVPEEVRVIREEGRILAFAQWKNASWHLELKHLYVDPDCQGRGLGTRLLEQAKSEATHRGKPVELQALKGSPANGFYLSQGCRVLGNTEFDNLFGWNPPERLVAWRDLEQSAWEDYVTEWDRQGEVPIPSSTRKGGRDYAAMREFWAWSETTGPEAEGYVTNFTYFMVDPEGKILGAVSYRPVVTPRLLENGGHMGYGLAPSARGRKLGRRLIELVGRRAVDESAQELAPCPRPDRVLLTCDEDNPASARTIESAGGQLQDKPVFMGVPTRRYWIDLTKP